MAKVITISSEIDLKKENYNYFKYNLSFNQISFYVDKGAELYYQKITKDNLEKDSKRVDKVGLKLVKDDIDKNKPFAFVSLGCGSGEVEKPFLTKLKEMGYDFSYYGVDSSMQMIEIARDKFKDSIFDSNFIYSDFSSEKFKSEQKEIIGEDRRKIFALLGGTLGNVPQNYMANSLQNMLKKDDILWIAVRASEELSNEVANKYFKIYLQRIKNEKDKEFLTNPLKENTEILKNGKLAIDMIREPSINALKFDFSFIVEKEKIDIVRNKEKTTFLKGDKINLFTNRVYEKKSLIKFFENRNFELIYQKMDSDILQIILKKI